MTDVNDLAQQTERPPFVPGKQPDPEEVLFGAEQAPALPPMNIFPIEWRVETPKLLEIYEQARDPGWAPSRLPWNTLDVNAFTQDQRYAIGYWFGLLSVFDSSGPAVFARAMIHTYETHEEDPIRKCFFSVTRDEVNHEEVCGRAIQLFTPGGPLGFEPQTPLGKLARNNIEWLYHNGARYWEAFKNGVHKYPVPILFTSFLFGEMAAATLFHAMHQRTTIPVLKEAFRCIGQDEARHLGICLTILQKILPGLVRLLGTPVPEEVLLRTAALPVDRAQRLRYRAAGPRSRLGDGLQKFAGAGGIPASLRLACRLLFPDRAYMRATYGGKSTWSLLISYPARWITVLREAAVT